jgi:hypothetical protein
VYLVRHFVLLTLQYTAFSVTDLIIADSFSSECVSGRRTEGFVWEFHSMSGDALEVTMIIGNRSHLLNRLYTVYGRFTKLKIM